MGDVGWVVPGHGLGNGKSKESIEEVDMEIAQEAILKLMEWMEEAAPGVWAIAVKQAAAVGITNLAGGVIMLLVAIGLAALTVWFIRNDNELGYWLSSLFATLAFLIAIPTVVEGVKYLINPEWYAIQGLLGLVK